MLNYARSLVRRNGYGCRTKMLKEDGGGKSEEVKDYIDNNGESS